MLKQNTTITFADGYDLKMPISSTTKQGFNSALFLTPPKFEVFEDGLETPVRDLEKNIDKLKLDSNSFTSGSKDISKLSGIKNCISKDLLQRLEESSPISINQRPFRYNDSMAKKKNFCNEIEEETLNNENESNEEEVSSRILKDITNEFNNSFRKNIYQKNGGNFQNNWEQEENSYFTYVKENLLSRLNKPFSTGMSNELREKIFNKKTPYTCSDNVDEVLKTNSSSTNSNFNNKIGDMKGFNKVQGSGQGQKQVYGQGQGNMMNMNNMGNINMQTRLLNGQMHWTTNQNQNSSLNGMNNMNCTNFMNNIHNIRGMNNNVNAMTNVNPNYLQSNFHNNMPNNLYINNMNSMNTMSNFCNTNAKKTIVTDKVNDNWYCIRCKTFNHHSNIFIF